MLILCLDLEGVLVPFLEAGQQIAIDPASERLQLMAPWPAWREGDFLDMPVLIKTQGKTTTDQISPAGPWMRFRGHIGRSSEALLLGGNTATLHEGQVTQFGPTAEVYRRPVDLVTAVTFSDPPLNTVEVTKSAQSVVSRNGALRMPASGSFEGLAPGDYTIGLRPHHLHLAQPSPQAVSVRATVKVSEITGSESFIHAAFAEANWVVSTQGVHNLELGSEIDIWVDPARMFVFDRSGRLAAAPDLAAAA